MKGRGDQLRLNDWFCGAGGAAMTATLTDGLASYRDALLADLLKRGYQAVDEHRGLRAGVRVCHRNQRWHDAERLGTAEVLVITEKPNSPWSRQWHMPDVEMLVLWDTQHLSDGPAGRISQLAQYHVYIAREQPEPTGGEQA